MFQYAAGRAIAKNSNAELVLDQWSGFARDYQYKRAFQLSNLKVVARGASRLERSAIWLYRLENKVISSSPLVHEHRFYSDFIIERNFSFAEEVLTKAITRDAWLIGYWQSPKYFDAYAELLRHELMPRHPTDQNFIELDLLISQSDSVALGIRLYEESKNPADHALLGKVKSVEDINRAIDRVRSVRPKARFFVFCTHRSEELKKLNLPVDTIFVTPDDGYSDPIDCLWLLTRCKHHIFTNSSYYWWGAWLSHAIHNKDEQLIYAADNFINIDGLCEHWSRF
jgi:hypothetical protein